MMSEILVNTGSGNGLLPDGTKPLPEPMLTLHYWGSVAVIWEQFYSKHPSYYSDELVWNFSSKIIVRSSRGQWVNEAIVGNLEADQLRHWWLHVAYSVDHTSLFIFFIFCSCYGSLSQCTLLCHHLSIMSSQITSNSTVCSTACSG